MKVSEKAFNDYLKDLGADVMFVPQINIVPSTVCKIYKNIDIKGWIVYKGRPKELLFRYMFGNIVMKEKDKEKNDFIIDSLLSRALMKLCKEQPEVIDNLINNM